jgi:hypothetical protein
MKRRYPTRSRSGRRQAVSARTRGCRAAAPKSALRAARFAPELAPITRVVEARRPRHLPPDKSARDPSTQNSLPSGSPRTIQVCSPCPTSTRVAPKASSRSTSASRSSGRKSRCRRFFVVLGSETGTKRSPGSRSSVGLISNSSGSSFTTTQPSASRHRVRGHAGRAHRRSSAPTRGS